MQTVIRESGSVIVGGRSITTDEARKILRLLRTKKNACKGKKEKLTNRIEVIERFIDETAGKKITLGQWMKSKGLNFKAFYSSMGYYTPLQAVVSDDDENEVLTYHRPMKFNPEAGFFVPKRKVVTTDHHNTITQSRLGMTYNPKLAQYFPTTIYDTNAYTTSEEELDEAMDIVGGFTVKDLANLSACDEDAQELIEDVKEFYEEEYDNIVDEEDAIDHHSAQILMGEDYYGADGKPVKNVACKTACNFKRKSKRPACFSGCDKKYPPTKKQVVRREEAGDRREARKEKRETKKELRKDLRAGKISVKEFRAGKKDARKEKRAKVKASGGNFLARAWKGVAKVFPLTLVARGGAIILIEKMNAFGFATRIAPALLPEDEAKKLFKPESIPKAKKAWAKLQRAWETAGGNADKLKSSIIKGYKKKPNKISRKQRKKSGFDGYNEYEYSNVAGVDDAVLASAITAGLGLITTLIGVISKAGAEKDPFISPPADYKEAMNNGTLDDPAPDPTAPAYDSKSGEWIDPSSGKAIDPQTGEFKDTTILGMNRWVVIGLGIAVVGGAIYFLTKKKGTGN